VNLKHKNIVVWLVEERNLFLPAADISSFRPKRTVSQKEWIRGKVLNYSQQSKRKTL
jgi:hypothetical protein